ncbi:MAG: UDP-N-acetylglucosamine--N-acetylmuramyl-(pentapeptide) pyrophosphoryl-undecaprenol N-acetylglucosamine transferase [Verrucomicrobia bacterium]|nr:UDP-N-acetylglucosamine--N-acetylmuramyl-(pentapeptide) pyrophosphoryl-undecaprenol N-acetylglucosamine transferase [Verrucomicrobiota bacterium]
MEHRVVLTAGKTGGHLYPAQGLARQLQTLGHAPLFIGSGLKKSPFFAQEQFPFAQVVAAPPSKRRPWNLFTLAWGTLQAWRSLRKAKAKVVVGFGGYSSAPALFAALIARIPIVLHEGNVIPGRVTRLFSKWARHVAVQLPLTGPSLGNHVVEVAMPSRFQKRFSRQEALDFFGLHEGRKTLLVFGGSQGALHLNQTVVESLTDFPADQLQVIHFTGEEVEGYKEAYRQKNISAYVRSFEPRIDLAWSLADLALIRAGAASIAEQIEWQVPAIFVPYPHALDGHQEANARFISEKVGGGVVLLAKHCTPDRLAAAFRELIQRGEEMQGNLKNYYEQPRSQLLEIVEKYL